MPRSDTSRPPLVLGLDRERHVTLPPSGPTPFFFFSERESLGKMHQVIGITKLELWADPGSAGAPERTRIPTASHTVMLGAVVALRWVCSIRPESHTFARPPAASGILGVFTGTILSRDSPPLYLFMIMCRAG